MKGWKLFFKNERRKYYVNKKGEIKSVTKHGKERLLKQQNVAGYKAVYLLENGKQKWEYVHRIVAQAFIPNPDNLPQVNHKDEDKTNNKVKNLEWCTNHYNANYGTCKERIKDTNIKKGIWADYRGMTIAEKEEAIRKRQRKYYQKTRKSELNHHFYIYKEVVTVTKKYELVGEYDKESDAAEQLGVSPQTINHSKRYNRKFKKEYIATQSPIE